MIHELLSRFDPEEGSLDGASVNVRHLSDIRQIFADQSAVEAALRHGDPEVYRVATREYGQGEGQLHIGFGILMPGTVGREYFMTRGHFHTWRPAAEVYIGLKGRGKMILEDEAGKKPEIVDLLPNSTLYVPGHVAHRTVNVGTAPLVYFGIYPAAAGHDYASIEGRNFRMVVVCGDDGPVILERERFLETLLSGKR